MTGALGRPAAPQRGGRGGNQKQAEILATSLPTRISRSGEHLGLVGASFSATC